MSRLFIPSRLDDVENVEEYRPGGFHPVHIDDTFVHGRFRVLHKLGFGGSSTIWLARDQQQRGGKLVALKVMRADTPRNAPDLVIPRALRQTGRWLRTIDDHFLVNGPNGCHLVLVSAFAGPSILAMLDASGRTKGSRRLRADLARKVAKQVAHALEHMHRAGFVHGDLTTSNILFHPSDQVLNWSDNEVYMHLGLPETEKVWTCSGYPVGPQAPSELVQAIDHHSLIDCNLLEEDIVVIDFGQSYAVEHPPKDYHPGTVVNYVSPEVRFDGRASFEADVWALACAFFELRAGFPLFDSFFGSDTDILRQTVETLGRLPDPWWGAFQDRSLWFEDNGQPKSMDEQQEVGQPIHSSESSIRHKLHSVGMLDDPPLSDEGSMFERTGTKVDDEEVELLADLLEKMLRYCPEDRITIKDAIEHPWFTM
ncbi:kinase-like protein [Gymnopus androsaceus JB14]|uniref:Kinase-like protein n=1 Tax=Gymnopus androsaceus JB14 TaxID=1447944 RepID=A0A6A4H2B1_9AGAR|nr:kinase-like protein [Gymnopus androsaceus JB14]